MSSLDISVPHNLPKEEAVARLKKLMATLQEEQKDMIQEVSEEWEGGNGRFQFKAKGFSISGNIKVEEDKVSLNSELPFMLSFFKDKIEQIIKSKASNLLAP